MTREDPEIKLTEEEKKCVDLLFYLKNKFRRSEPPGPPEQAGEWDWLEKPKKMRSEELVRQELAEAMRKEEWSKAPYLADELEYIILSQPPPKGFPPIKDK